MLNGIIYALLAVLSWGIAIVLSKTSLNTIDAASLFFYQIIAAAGIAWATLLIQKKKLALTKYSLIAYGLGIFEPFLAYMLTLYGMEYISAGAVAIIFSLESMFILLLSIVILRITVPSIWTFSLLLLGAMIGSLLAILPDTVLENRNKFGYILVTLGVLSAAFYVVISSKLIKSFDPIILLTGQITLSLILSGLYMQFINRHVDTSVDFKLVSIAAISGILQYFLAFYLYLHALRWVSVNIAGAMLYFIPIITLTLSWVFLDEKISLIQLSGILIVISCLYLLNKKYTDTCL